MGLEKLVLAFIGNSQESRNVDALEVVISNFKAYCKAVMTELVHFSKKVQTNVATKYKLDKNPCVHVNFSYDSGSFTNQMEKNICSTTGIGIICNVPEKY